MDQALHTIVALTLAHLIADFVVQTDWMVARKRSPGVFLVHIVVVGAASALTIGWLPLVPLATLMASHALMDAIKLLWLRGLAGFVVDQSVHLAAIVAVALVWPDLFDRGAWTLLDAAATGAILKAFVAAAAVIAAVRTGGIVIGLILAGVDAPEHGGIKGLDQGGRMIGWLERALTLLFMAIGQPSGVGFLVAAKSILRFGDIKDSSDRARAEYIMIGTFLSFGWAIAVAAAAQAVAVRL